MKHFFVFCNDYEIHTVQIIVSHCECMYYGSIVIIVMNIKVSVRSDQGLNSIKIRILTTNFNLFNNNFHMRRINFLQRRKISTSSMKIIFFNQNSSIRNEESSIRSIFFCGMFRKDTDLKRTFLANFCQFWFFFNILDW